MKVLIKVVNKGIFMTECIFKFLKSRNHTPFFFCLLAHGTINTGAYSFAQFQEGGEGRKTHFKSFTDLGVLIYSFRKATQTPHVHLPWTCLDLRKFTMVDFLRECWTLVRTIHSIEKASTYTMFPRCSTILILRTFPQKSCVYLKGLCERTEAPLKREKILFSS